MKQATNKKNKRSEQINKQTKQQQHHLHVFGQWDRSLTNNNKYINHTSKQTKNKRNAQINKQTQQQQHHMHVFGQ